jgi:hypothetical protein
MQETTFGWLWKLVFALSLILLLLAIFYTLATLLTTLTNGVQV